MKIVLDIQTLQTRAKYHGIGRVTFEVTKRLLSYNPEIFTLLINPSDPHGTNQIIKDLNPKAKVEIFHSPGFTNYFDIIKKHPSHFQEILQYYELMLEYRVSEICPDLYLFFYVFACDNLSSLGKLKKKFLSVCFFHDLIPFIFRKDYLSNDSDRAFYEYRFKECHKADFYFANSNCTKRDLIEFCGIKEDKIEVVYLGCSEIFKPFDPLEKLNWRNHFQRKYGIKEFILYNPSAGDKRKNLERLIKAYSALPGDFIKRYSLVITSRLDGPRILELKHLAQTLGIQERVVFTGYVSDAELCALYNLCSLFVFPSLYEGFGLPVLEAMNCGAPVIASNTSSLPEIVAEPEALFDPTNEEEITHKMKLALEREDYRKFLRKNSEIQRKRFSYDHTAKKVYDLLMELVSKRNKSSIHSPKPKLSLALAIPNEEPFAGIPLDEIVKFLSKNYYVKVLSPETLLNSAKDFDRVLYLVKNSKNSLKLYHTMTYIPGVVAFESLNNGQIFEDYEEISKLIYAEKGITGLLKLKKEGLCQTLNEMPFVKVLANKNIGALFINLEPESLHNFYVSISKERIRFLNSTGNAEELLQQIQKHLEELYENSSTWELLKTLSTFSTPTISLSDKVLLFSLNTERILDTGRILVDVSMISRFDLGTEIQRVAKAQLRGLLENPPPGYRVFAVRYDETTKDYYFAHSFLSKFLGVSIPEEDKLVHFGKGDILYCPDLNHTGVITAFNSGKYDAIRLAGTKIIFLVYDLLPIKYPHYCTEEIRQMHSEWLRIVLLVADKVVSTSQTVAEDILTFASREHLSFPPEKVVALPIGVDFTKADPSEPLDELELEILESIKKNPYFLMVSTIEPREGHRLILKAFEVLWSEGLNMNLVFAGKKGWLVDDLIDYIPRHPELSKRFFWLDNVSNQLLERLYRDALASIVASDDEGLGLPIVEAGKRACPVIARDIPAFREVGQDGVFYFPDTKDPTLVASYIKEWLALWQKGKAPDPSRIPWITWEQHCERLKRIMLEL